MSYLYFIGFKNQWGALLDQQAEIQRMADEQENHQRLAKNNKYKSELQAQLAEKNNKDKLEKQMRRNPSEQKMLSDDYKRFEQKEYDRMNMGRSKSKQVMLANQQTLNNKKSEFFNMAQQDKDVFNRQAMEDKLHAQKSAEEKKKWNEWQKESLKSNYDHQIQRKDYLSRMEKEKDRVYADQYKSSVENYEKNHNDTLNRLRQRNNQIMDAQSSTIIPDVNAERKSKAVMQMKKQFESTEKETLMKELKRLNHRNTEAQQTTEMLRMQMDLRKQKAQGENQEEASYKKYVDNTINMMSEREKKVAADKERLKQSYAKELENQIKEHNEREKRIYNEMDERSLKLNQRGLAAYETGDRAAGIFKLPGIDREKKDDREYFGRYTKRKEPSRMSGSLANSHAGALSERVNREMPKTSEEYLSRRRSSRGVFSPQSQTSNILGQPINNNTNNNASLLGKYKSMANIPSPDKIISSPEINSRPNEMNGLSRKSTILSPRNIEVPEYQPTERDNTARRSIPISEAPKPSVPKSEPKKEEIQKPAAQALGLGQPKFSKKVAPTSILDIDSQINQRILGSMRGGTFKLARDN